LSHSLRQSRTFAFFALRLLHYLPGFKTP